MITESLSYLYRDYLVPDIKDWSNLTGINVYIVGGACRDILNKSARLWIDVDFCIESREGARPLIEYLKSLLDVKGRPKYTIEEVVSFDNIGTLIVKIKHVDFTMCEMVEFAMTRKEIYNESIRRPERIEFASIQEDAQRRDFCCNAVYYDIGKDKLLDPTGKGVEDAKKGIIRAVKDPETSFREDPLRMLRAIRFYCTIRDSEIEEKTEEALKYYPEYEELSLDLIRPEFETLITYPYRNNSDPLNYRRSCDMIRILHDKGLLRRIIPDLEEAWGFNQNTPRHSMNLSDHLLSTLDWFHSMDNIEHGRLTEEKTILLSYAALLHDIGKYKYYQLQPDNTFSYHGHEKFSGKIAKKTLTRLGYSKETAKIVEGIINCHLLLKPYWDNTAKRYCASDKDTLHIQNEIINRVGREHFREVIELINADNNTHAPEFCKPNQVKQFVVALKKLGPKGDLPTRIYRMPKGDDIIKRLGLSKNDYPLIEQIKGVLEDIIPLQPGYYEFTESDVLDIYQGMFDHTFTVWWMEYSGIMKALEGEVDEEAGARYLKFWEYADITDPFDRERIINAAEGKDPKIQLVKVDVSNDNQKNVYRTYTFRINTIYFPRVYIKKQRNLLINNSYKKIKTGMDEISLLPGVSKIDSVLRAGDLSTWIEFNDNERITII